MYVKTTLVLTFALVAISTQNSRLVNGTYDQVTTLCKATTSYTACIDCVTSVPGTVTTTDIGVVEAVMTCAARAMDRLYEDAYTYQSSATDPVLREALGVCLDRDEAARPSINEVVNKVRSRDFNGAKGVISSRILDVVNACAGDSLKGIQLPEAVYNDLVLVNKDWVGLVMKMLDALH